MGVCLKSPYRDGRAVALPFFLYYAALSASIWLTDCCVELFGYTWLIDLFFNFTQNWCSWAAFLACKESFWCIFLRHPHTGKCFLGGILCLLIMDIVDIRRTKHTTKNQSQIKITGEVALRTNKKNSLLLCFVSNLINSWDKHHTL